MLTYGPNGVSRGVATIIFSKPGSAQDALQQLNGVLVDKRPMKVRFQLIQIPPCLTSSQVEIVVNATSATAAPAKGLGDRIA